MEYEEGQLEGDMITDMSGQRWLLEELGVSEGTGDEEEEVSEIRLIRALPPQ